MYRHTLVVTLPPAAYVDAEISDERALTIATNLAGGMEVQAPLGMSAHWFRYTLPVDLLHQGYNSLEVSTTAMCPSAGFQRSVSGEAPNLIS